MQGEEEGGWRNRSMGLELVKEMGSEMGENEPRIEAGYG